MINLRPGASFSVKQQAVVVQEVMRRFVFVWIKQARYNMVIMSFRGADRCVLLSFDRAMLGLSTCFQSLCKAKLTNCSRFIFN